jgi:hypothetical protein
MKALIVTMCCVPIAAHYNLPELGAILIMSGIFFVRVVTSKTKKL